MTYKELLFKMAKIGLLTLSNDKDGRGLFWADTGQYVHVENSSKAARKNARLNIDIDLRCHAFVQEGSDGKWWTPPDLNRWPPGYEPGALTRLS